LVILALKGLGWRISELKLQGGWLYSKMDSTILIVLSVDTLGGTLEVESRSPKGGWDVGGALELNLGLNLLCNLDQGLEFHLGEVLSSTGLSDGQGGLSKDGVLGDILDLVLNLDASASLLRVGVGLGDGFPNVSKSSLGGHGGGNLVRGPSSRHPNEGLVHLGRDDGLDQVLERVLGLLVVNLLNGGGLLGDGFDVSLLSGDGQSHHDPLVDGGARLNSVSLDRV